MQTQQGFISSQNSGKISLRHTTNYSARPGKPKTTDKQRISDNDFMKIFGGSKNELNLIKTMMATGRTQESIPVKKQPNSSKQPIPNFVRSDGFTDNQNKQFENLGKVGASKNDTEVKVEKALIELNEIRNDIMF